MKNLDCVAYTVSKGACSPHHNSTTMRVGCSSGIGRVAQQSEEYESSPGTANSSVSDGPEQDSLLFYCLSFDPGLGVMVIRRFFEERRNKLLKYSL